jgi:hypothetical protein
MALNVLRAVRFGRGGPAEPGEPTADDPLVFGEHETAVFPCPACGRTIPSGSGRCTGCGTRLLMDVALRRASAFLAAGLLAGLVAGGGLVGLAWASQPRPSAAATAPGQPGAAVVPKVAAPNGGPVIAADIPVAAASALRGTTQINARLATAATPLAEALRGSSFSVNDIAKVLRRMSADVRAGAGIVPALGSWDAATAHREALAAFYGRLSDAIGDGLGASIRSAGSYRSAGREVLKLLAELPALDAQGRGLAAGTEIGLPAATLPPIPGR